MISKLPIDDSTIMYLFELIIKDKDEDENSYLKVLNNLILAGRDENRGELKGILNKIEVEKLTQLSTAEVTKVLIGLTRMGFIVKIEKKVKGKGKMKSSFYSISPIGIRFMILKAEQDKRRKNLNGSN